MSINIYLVINKKILSTIHRDYIYIYILCQVKIGHHFQETTKLKIKKNLKKVGSNVIFIIELRVQFLLK